jgi:hypothetical protein
MILILVGFLVYRLEQTSARVEELLADVDNLRNLLSS